MIANQALNSRFLRANQVKLLNKFIECTSNCVQNVNLVEYAVNSPMNQQHYRRENNPPRFAAALSNKLNKNHALSNENKRTAPLAANLFLLQNRKLLQQDACHVGNNGIIAQIHDDVATSKMDESELARVFFPRNVADSIRNDRE